MFKFASWVSCLFVMGISLFLLSSCNSTTPALRYAKSSDDKTDINVFLEDAMFNGLVKDKFPAKLAMYIGNRQGQYFVPKCPVCTPVYKGLQKYIASHPTSKSSRLSKAEVERLQSSHKATRLEAFKELVGKYTTSHKAALSLTSTEKSVLESKLEEARKKGMGRKANSFGAFCPSCDGACGK